MTPARTVTEWINSLSGFEALGWVGLVAFAMGSATIWFAVKDGVKR